MYMACTSSGRSPSVVVRFHQSIRLMDWIDFSWRSCTACWPLGPAKRSVPDFSTRRCSTLRSEPGDTHHAQYCDFGQSAAGNEDAVGGRVQVGRSDLQAIVDQ